MAAFLACFVDFEGIFMCSDIVEGVRTKAIHRLIAKLRVKLGFDYISEQDIKAGYSFISVLCLFINTSHN